METSTKGVMSGKGQSGLNKSLGAFYHRVTGISLQHALPYEMFTHGVPYEASRTYRTMKSEFESKRCAAMVEAHRQALRGF
jgi:hypothetical protein